MSRVQDLFNTRPPTPEEQARQERAYRLAQHAILDSVRGPSDHEGGIRSRLIIELIDEGRSSKDAAEIADEALERTPSK